MALTPIPSLIVVALIDSIPLEPPERGLRRNHGYWVRAQLTTMLYTHTVIDQVCYYVPRLRVPMCARAAVAVSSATLTILTTYGLALAIGFPVPFTLTLLGLPWATFFTVSLWLVCRKFLHENPAVLREVLRYSPVFLCQLSMVSLYPAFLSAFSSLGPSGQTALVLVLPLIKLTEKNLMSRVLSDRDDIKPELVIFSVEVFSALFASLCMQSSSSNATNFVIMGIDFLQACISMYDVNAHLKEINVLAAKMGVPRGEEIRVAIAMLAAQGSTADSDASLAAGPKINKIAPLAAQGLLAAGPKVSANQIASLEEIRSATMLPEDQLELCEKLRRVLFLTEFVLLVEFTEIMIPVVYAAYVCVLFYLPNRVYYPRLGSMDTDDLHRTVGSVLSYAGMELVSFVVLCVVLQRKLRASAMHQLAFVLERQWAMVQSKMVLWIVFMLQSTLVHLGADYTFQFKWLRSPPPPQT
ncbi:hypothetical protein PybrP1_011340 [[Pythium] brassicae (nom. inval.)]|nr:hypothetical protein PybrP1_011340 [[Pythium] brassicae (nom. inval.)]